VNNLASHHEDMWRCGDTAPHILALGSRWRWVVSFTPRSIYLQRKSLRYPMDMRLGGSQNQCRRCGEEKRIEPRFHSRPYHNRCTDWAILFPLWVRIYMFWAQHAIISHSSPSLYIIRALLHAGTQLEGRGRHLVPSGLKRKKPEF
jgi:hypothetical protein